MGEMKFPEMKIGEVGTRIGEAISQEAGRLEAEVDQKIAPLAGSAGQSVEQGAQYAEKTGPSRHPSG